MNSTELKIQTSNRKLRRNRQAAGLRRPALYKEMIDFLTGDRLKKHISFHMPGHKGSGIYKRYGYDRLVTDTADLDITEIPGADNLHQAEGIIRETEKAYERIYGSEKTFLLVNGASCGIMAAVMASVGKGRKLLMSRGNHKSVFAALELAGAKPCYISPEYLDISGYGSRGSMIMGPVTAASVEKALAEDSEIDALIIPSPNYYGIASPIREIADVVHRYGKILIVDQAHGAHLAVFHTLTDAAVSVGGKRISLPEGAETQGADIVIDSTHKTLATFTQSAVLNVCTDRPDIFRIGSFLRKVQTTSPSYLLMASMDVNRRLIEEHGKEIFCRWLEDLEWFYNQVEKLPGRPAGIWPGLDFTRICIDMSAAGISGRKLETILMERGIVPEMVTGNVLVAMTGMGNVRSDYEALLEALGYASEHMAGHASEKGPEHEDGPDENTPAEGKGNGTAWRMPVPEVSYEHGDEIMEMDLSACGGQVCGDLIVPYPPGIPVLCPGEIITEEIIENIERIRGEGCQVMGLSSEGRIHVYKCDDNSSD